MKYLTLFKVVMLIFLVTSCKKDNKIKFPVLITSEYDTVIQINSKEMMISEPIVYGINVKDTLRFSGSFNYLSHNFD
jgi:hypothetical protein